MVETRSTGGRAIKARSHTPRKPASAIRSPITPGAPREQTETPAPRRSTRNEGKAVDYYKPLDLGENTAPDATATPVTPFTPATLFSAASAATTRTTLTSPPDLLSPPPLHPPSQPKITGVDEYVTRFLQSFPNGYVRENVSGEGLLCGLRAVSRSVELQFGKPAPTVEELHAIARSQAKSNRATFGTDYRNWERDFAVVQLALLVLEWGRLHDRDLGLGWLLSNGAVVVDDGPNGKPDMDLVWIYNTNGGNATSDFGTDHYGALRRADVPAPTPVRETRTSSKKRSATSTPAATSAPERPAKRQRVKTKVERCCSDDSDQDDGSVEQDTQSDNDAGSVYLPCNEDQDIDDDPGDLYDENGPDCLDGSSEVLPGDNELESSQADAARPTAVRDAQGLFRVGMQPQASHVHDVRSIPRDNAAQRMRHAVVFNISNTDKTFPGATDEYIRVISDDLLAHLMARMTTMGGDDKYLKRYCDYTGLEMLWTPGPTSPSVEAVYQAVQAHGRLAYHGSTNVGMIMAFLNMMKRRFPILVLPITSAFMRAETEAQRTWALVAADNLCALFYLFNLAATHQAKFAEWSRKRMDSIEDMLDVMRTGVRTRQQRERLAECNVGDVFRTKGGTSASIDEAEIIRSLRRIAASYSLTPEEFDALCFVDSKSGGQVFYPFWYQSKSLATVAGWSWSALIRFAAARLKRLRSHCNRNGEKEGLGEKEMTPLLVVYWIAHWICQKIKEIKDTKKARTVEEIAPLLLDRWGLPMVPWARHIWAASFCKKQDHGIAMLFGLISSPGGVYDPVHCFDHSRCTITIDSGATNMGMGFSSTDYWPRLCEILRTVPLHTPLWRPDESLGLSRWVGQTKAPRPRPQAPTPRFTMPLLDISLWTSDRRGDISEHFRCDTCQQRFRSIGEWIRHCREQHGDPSTTDAVLDRPAPNQQAMDAAYWETFGVCDECGKRFLSKYRLEAHKLGHRTEKLFKCEEPDCNKVYNKKAELAVHIKSHSDDRLHVCPECESAFRRPGDLSAHMKRHGEKNHLCPVCGKGFINDTELRRHAKRHNPEKAYKCAEPECGKAFATPDGLKVHQLTHSSDRPYKCPEAGCDGSFKKASSLARHSVVHQKDRATYDCTEPGCGKSFKSQKTLSEHVENPRAHENIHVEKPHKCTEPGCGKAYVWPQSLEKHQKKEH